MTQKLKVAVQMDHVATINPLGDSTFALMLEAQARGHELLHYTPDTLALSGDVVSALDELDPARLARVGGRRWPSVTAAAPSPAATVHRAPATPTTSGTGPTAGPPHWPTLCSSVATTTAPCTGRPGR